MLLLVIAIAIIATVVSSTVITEQGETRYVLVTDPSENPYCRALQTRVRARRDLFMENCNMARISGLTRRRTCAGGECHSEARCRMGGGGVVFYEWHRNPYLAQCAAYEQIAALKEKE